MNFDPFGVFRNDPFFRDALRDPFFSRDVLREPRLLEQPSGQLATTQPSTALSAWGMGTRLPRMDVTETDKSYIVKADLPGLQKDQVHVHVQNDMLTIEGERQEEKEERTENRYLSERSFGKFSRSVRLPTDANPEQIEAKMDHGVLNVTINKLASSEAGKKRIEIA